MEDTILIFEDDPLLGRLYTRLLASRGRVRLFGSAEEGIQALATADVVITDLDMPGMGGLGLLRRLRDLPRCPPVLVVSGSPDLMAEVPPWPHVRTLAKPFTLPAMDRALADLRRPAPPAAAC